MIDCKHMSAAADSAIPLEAPMDGERFDKFRAVAAAAKAHGALVIGQLNHPGRQIPSKIIQESISASAVQLGESIPNATCLITPELITYIFSQRHMPA